VRRLVVLHTNDIHGRPEAIALGLTPTDGRDIYASMSLELPGELPLVETHAAAEVGPPASRIHGRLPHTAVLGDVDRAAGGAG
jgi:hypothetical protein